MNKSTCLLLALSLGLVAVGCSADDLAGASPMNAGARDGKESSRQQGDPQNAGTAAPGGPGLPGETYGATTENDWVDTAKEKTSTFGIDVDTGSYSIMRRDLLASRMPNKDGVRPEEYINYFNYGYAPPTDGKPFAIHLDGAPSAFGSGFHLLRVAMQGKPVDEQQRQRANLIFLVDVSGSMQTANKLPLVQYTLRNLVERLRPTDTLGIVTYASNERVLLEPTAVNDKAKIIAAINGLSAGGSTNGEGGIVRAYELAEKAKLQEVGESNNRVILCTDGDFNVGLTGQALIDLIEKKRDTGITLTTLGYGQGNYNDFQMERLADHGNGNYAYVDSEEEANRIVGKRFVSMLQVIAKDAKIQVEFDPSVVSRYRLIGYENRVLSNEDFANDKKDSGDLGAGHNVTAFYEVALTDAAKQGQVTVDAAGAPSKLATVRLRYKQPRGDQSELVERPLPFASLHPSFDAAPASFRFAAATGELAEIFRHSTHSEGARFDDVTNILRAAAENDPDKLQLVDLAARAKTLYKP
jgi:Ca-activated chloride channel homolog